MRFYYNYYFWLESFFSSEEKFEASEICFYNFSDNSQFLSFNCSACLLKSLFFQVSFFIFSSLINNYTSTSLLTFSTKFSRIFSFISSISSCSFITFLYLFNYLTNSLFKVPILSFSFFSLFSCSSSIFNRVSYYFLYLIQHWQHCPHARSYSQCCFDIFENFRERFVRFFSMMVLL